MSEPISPGDWVECIDASIPTSVPEGAQHLVLGALYCVDQIRTGSSGRVGLVLRGMPRTTDGRLVVYLVSRFRPIRDGQERIVKKERVSA